MNLEIEIIQLSEEDIKRREIDRWPIWTKEVSKFPWTYDSREECLILEGEVVVSTERGEYHIKAGDFVIFHEGVSCRWEIKKPIRKHYNFA
ncbi:MAG: cupin domain-containing protein [Bacteroidales bacterium]|nr:cupin domain-containing protein [Bacteroidales bacterium]